MPDDQYLDGRTKVLETFLGRESIYRTPTLRDQFELQARQNISGELVWLR